jgi:hypothetical protein
MIIIDTAMRYDGENYRAIGAKGETEDAYLYFGQPLDERLEAQRSHDSALNCLLEQEEDILVRKSTLEYEQDTPDI